MKFMKITTSSKLILFSLLSVYLLNVYGSNSCPSVFVVPDDPQDVDIIWVNGTTCALGCKTPVWTDQEWYIMETIGLVFTYAGVPMDFIVIITWSFNKEKRRKQYFVLTFAICSFLVQIFIMYNSSIPFEKAFCRTNATIIRPKDGLHMCNVAAVAAIYGVNGGGASWMLQSVDIWLKVVLGWKSTDKLKPYYLLFILGLPLILTIVSVATGQFGYQRGHSFCFMDDPAEGWYYDVPQLIFLFVGSIAIFSVIYKIMAHVIKMRKSVKASSTRSSGGGGGNNDIFKVVKSACLFVTSYYVFSFPVLAYRYYMWMHYSSKGSSFIDIADTQPWIDCIFTHFDGTDVSWRSACGMYPKDRIPIALATACLSICAHGTALLISSTYIIQPSVWKIWYRWIRMDKIDRLADRYITTRNVKVSTFTHGRSWKSTPVLVKS